MIGSNLMARSMLAISARGARALLPAVLAAASLLALSGEPAPAASRNPPPSITDSFRIGNRGVVCTAERRGEDSHYVSMFDRAYEIVCRDAAEPVGQLYALTGNHRLDDAKIAALAGPGNPCEGPARSQVSDGVTLQRLDCRDTASGLTRVIYTLVKGGKTYAAQGLLPYDSVLVLGLRTLAADSAIPGEVSVAVTGADDPAALARMQSARLDPAQALAAGYARANDGNHADASEYFERLVQRVRAGEANATRPAEYLVNLAMEQSVLGNSVEADRLFKEATRAGTGGDPNFNRLYRNFTAMHRMNLADPKGAITILDAPLLQFGNEQGFKSDRLRDGFVDVALSQRLDLDDPARARLWGGAQSLSEEERAILFDAQASFIRGEAERMLGQPARARADFELAYSQFVSVRGGLVTSMSWLPADVALGQAGIAESEGRKDAAEAYLEQAANIFAASSPDSAALLSVKARLAGAYASHGKTDQAIAAYRELVAKAPSIPGGSTALRGRITPYFAALAMRGDQPGIDSDFFLAAQAMVRPGVAQTQAVLAREFSGGSSEASGLFRQSLTLSREIVGLDVAIGSFVAADPHTQAELDAHEAAIAKRQLLAAQQTAVQAKLASFPRYRAISSQTATLADLRAALRPDEAYYKLVIAGNAAYAAWVRPQGGRIFKVGLSPSEIESLVGTVRDSIVMMQGNQIVTNPFDLVSSHKLYRALFGPVAADVANVRHLIFEPDGAMLKLPVNVLVTDPAGIEAYTKRLAKPGSDEFDFTGVAWLGREHLVTTAVSARSFLDVRAIAPATGKRRYLGLGQNTKPAQSSYAPSPEGRDPCDWPMSTWKKPVNGAELGSAARLLGGANEVTTGEGFTDTGLLQRTDLADFRVIQFATHGLVTAPHPGCPARPALVTSFGPGGSDGLLSFKEIFSLHLNADTVVLSACDTAGAASAAATREAGITTGGNFALDGLVRAFVGAGARAVIASHWPVPDDYNATNRLMSGMFQHGTDRSVGESLRLAQNALMDDPLTSHPYYWGAFAIVGDATKPLTSPAAASNSTSASSQ